MHVNGINFSTMKRAELVSILNIAVIYIAASMNIGAVSPVPVSCMTMLLIKWSASECPSCRIRL